MPSYRAAADRPDQAKAIAAVIAVHAALAAIILTGLNVPIVTAAVEQLKTFDIRVPPPPPPQPPPPAPRPSQAKKEAGAPAKKAEATPVVAPPPRIPAPSPIPAAKIAGTGSSSSQGAGTAGTGTGAGGQGTGTGGGGYGDFSRFTPARLVSKIPNREYRRISAGRIPRGSASIGFRVNPNGRISNCRIVRSSGDAYVDANVCEAATRYLVFSPARDPSGRAVAQDLTYTPNWRPSY
jgi:periplasmic protein TonB